MLFSYVLLCIVVFVFKPKKCLQSIYNYYRCRHVVVNGKYIYQTNKNSKALRIIFDRIIEINLKVKKNNESLYNINVMNLKMTLNN